LRFPARLDHVAPGILLHAFDRIVEREKLPVRNNIHARLLQLFLAKRSVVLQPVRIRRAANHFLALLAQRLRFFALAKRVVENNDIRPIHVLFPILRLRHEPIRDVALLLVADEVAHLMALFRHLPRNIADQSRERHEQKILFLHRAPHQI
jgi:hypothetical protein